MMSVSQYYCLLRHAKHCGRFLAVLLVVPTLMLSPLTAQAIVIHDHHGHDTHGHALMLCDLDAVRENSEHQHEEHKHDDHPVDPAEDDDTTILIVLDIPEALAGARTSSGGAAFTAGIGAAVRTLGIDNCVAADVRPPPENRTTLACIRRAHGLVTGLLLTNHALLL